MVLKIHPWGVIWVPISRLMWTDQLKKLTAVPSIYKEVHDVGQQSCIFELQGNEGSSKVCH